MAVKDLSNCTFGNLAVLGRGVNDNSKNAQWICKCKCGNEALVRGYQLTSGKTKSCGCLVGKTSHPRHGHYIGNKPTKLYRLWRGIKERCLNKKNKDYFRYGGRGITIASEWLDFNVFVKEIPKPDNDTLQLDRIDNNKGYEPNNCRWVTARENSRNKSNSNTKIRWGSCVHKIEENFNFCPLCGMPLSVNPGGEKAGIAQ